MSEQDVNTQSQPTETPAATGPNVAEIQAELERVRKESEGRLRDLQAERNKRQEYEQRLNSPAPSAVKPDEDELGTVLKPYIAPIKRQAEEAVKELETMRHEKAQNYLTSKTGKAWEELNGDTVFQDRMAGVVRKYGITGNIFDMTVRAYELMQLEDLKAKEVERVRLAQASQTASLPSGTGSVAPATASKKYTAAEFSALPAREFAALEKSGDWRKLPDGSFEHLPRS
jgi:hypothetical protein